MAITAVSGARLTGNVYDTTFTGRRKNRKNADYTQQRSSNGTALKSLPIIFILSTVPAELNSGNQAQYMMYQQPPIEMPAIIPSNNVPTASIVGIDDPNEAYPLGWAYLKNSVIKETIPTIGGGCKANLVLSGSSDSKDIYKVYYIESKTKDDNLHHRPPEVQGLIYHNLGENKEFLGLKLREYMYHDKNNPNKLTGYMYSEVKLYDEKSGQYMIDLIANDTKWNNKTDITFEITNNPKVMAPEVY